MGTEITRYDERWAAEAQKFAEHEPNTSTTYLSTQGGRFSLGDQDLGTELCVVIADAIRENVLYEGKYVPGEKNPPVCYAFGRDEDDMAPHPSMQEYPDVFFPQNDICATCDHNKWGSAEVGRGKSCKNQRRLGLIPAGMFVPQGRGRPPELDLFTQEEHYINADLVTLKLPVTSVKGWAKYVNNLASTVGRPPYGVFTRMWIESHKDNQYMVMFEMIEEVPDELIDVVIGRHQGAEEALIRPYKPWEDGDDDDDRGRGRQQQKSRPTLRRG